MKYVLLSISLFLTCNYALSQQVQIFGKVTDLEGEPLSGATIKYRKELGTVADLNGNFHIATDERNTLLSIRFIGFYNVDTLITASNKLNVFVQIKMRPELTELPDIEITSSYQNIFDNYKHHIVDFTISNDLFYLIIKKGRKSFLCTANLKGVILEEQLLEVNYSKFHNSCLGGIILIGNVHCAELHTIDDKIINTNQFNIDYFDKYIVPCKLEMEGNLFFKGITRHNKKIDFFTYKEPGVPTIIHTVYDEVSERVSKSYFRDIFIEYYKSLEDIQPGDIDFGFGLERQNILTDESWSGDIQDLIVTNYIHQMVIQYQALGQKEVRSDMFVVDEKLYILDQLNKIIFKVNDDLETINIGCQITFNDDIEIITDYKSASYFLDNEVLYSVTPSRDELSIQKVKTLDHIYFTDRVVLHKNIIYRLGRKSIDNVRKTIYKDQL